MSKQLFFILLFLFAMSTQAAPPWPTPYNKETGLRILKATQKFGIQDEDLLKLILGSNPELNIRDKIYNGTPLYWAAIKNRPTTVKILLNYKAKVNVQDKMGNTPLMGASQLGFMKVVQLLLPYSPDITIKNKNGKDAIDLAEDNGHIEIVKLLKKYRKDYTSLSWDDDGENDADLVDTMDPINTDNIPFDEVTFNNQRARGKWKGLQSAFKIAQAYKTSDMDLYGDIDLDGVRDDIDDDDDGDGILDFDEKSKGLNDRDSDGTPDFIDRDGGTGKIDAGVIKTNDDNKLDIALKKVRKHPSDIDIKKVGLKTIGTQTEEEDSIIKQLKSGKFKLGKVIDTLREDGQDIDLTDDETGMNMAHLAVLNQNYDLLNFLIGRGINFDKKDNDGFTPLMYAALYGYQDLIKLLLLWNADPHIKNNDGNMAKDLAQKNGHIPSFDYLKFYEDLIKNKKELADRVKKRRKGIIKSTPQLIALKKAIEVKGRETGFDRKDKNKSKELLGFLKLKRNKGKIAALSAFLKNSKVDVNHKDDNDGETPLHIAVKNNDIPSARNLLENNADPNQQDKKGRTPLMIAVKSQNFDMVLLLLKYTPDINHKDNNSNDALNLAIQTKNKEILDLLNEYKKLLEELIAKAKKQRDEDHLPRTLDSDKDDDGLDDDTEDPDKGTGRLSRNTSLWRSIGLMSMLRKKVNNLEKLKPKGISKPVQPLKKMATKSVISISDFNVAKMGQTGCVYKKRRKQIGPRKFKTEEIIFVKNMKITLKVLPPSRPLYFINVSGDPMKTGKDCVPRTCKDTNIFYGLEKRKTVFFQNKEVPLGPGMKNYIQVYEGVPNGDVVNVDITGCKNYPETR
ncbi:MAG: ankyrin repeat domain-containing protein [Bacteriovoracaceae bacterium]